MLASIACDLRSRYGHDYRIRATSAIRTYDPEGIMAIGHAVEG